MKAHPARYALLPLALAVFLAASPAPAPGLEFRWATKQQDGTRSTPAPLFADFDGDGRMDIAAVDVTDQQGVPVTHLRVRSTLTGDVTFDSGAFTFIVHTLEAVDVDADGLPDIALMGQSLPNEPNYLLFGFNGFMHLKGGCRFLNQGEPDMHAFGQLYPGAPLELVSLRLNPATGNHQLQAHRIGYDGLYADVEIASFPHSIRIEDANGNGLDEVYVKLPTSIAMYAHPEAVAGAPAPAPADAQGLALARPFPNPSREGTTLRFTLSASSPVTLRVLDAAGRQVREIRPGVLEPGDHSLAWDARDDSGRRLAPGVYWLEVAAGGERGVRRVVQLN